MMSGCDERGLFLFYRTVAKQMPQLVRQWELAYNDDTCPDKFAETDVLFKEQNFPQQIVGQYGRERNLTYTDTATPSLWQRIKMMLGWRPQPRIRISAPLVLRWLFFGRSFETMVLMLEKQAKRPGAGMLDIQTCSYVSRLVIQTSIKGHYRTCEDWERFFAGQNAARSGKLGEWALKEVREDEAPTLKPVPESHQQLHQSLPLPSADPKRRTCRYPLISTARTKMLLSGHCVSSSSARTSPTDRRCPTMR